MDRPNLPMSSTSPLALSADGGAIPIRWVEDLFARLAAILGGAMSNVYASADPERVKAEWAEALAGFSADEVKRGLAACRTRKFAPNLGEFLHLCRPALDPEVAWLEAEQGLQAAGKGEAFAWSHPAVFWAARAMAFEIRSTPFAQVRKRWELALNTQWAAGQWLPIPDPTVRAIRHDPAPPAADPRRLDAAMAQLAEARRRLTGFRTKAEQDAAFRRAEEQALREPIEVPDET
jgi:hypothetical protein